jgi:small subunit ribosomal protein S9
MAKTKKESYIYASGKRKNASARVRLYKGTGQTQVNGLPIAEYFPGEVLKSNWGKPFELTDTWGKYYATIKVVGGGKNGQVEAVSNALAKALVSADKENYKINLKKAGLLTRDARERQRRMVGTGGKARRAKQSPKR